MAAARPLGATSSSTTAPMSRRSALAGVHVGQDDLPPAVARRLLGPSALVGLLDAHRGRS